MISMARIASTTLNGRSMRRSSSRYTGEMPCRKGDESRRKAERRHRPIDAPKYLDARRSFGGRRKHGDCRIAFARFPARKRLEVAGFADRLHDEANDLRLVRRRADQNFENGFARERPRLSRHRGSIPPLIQDPPRQNFSEVLSPFASTTLRPFARSSTLKITTAVSPTLSSAA